MAASNSVALSRLATDYTNNARDLKMQEDEQVLRNEETWDVAQVEVSPGVPKPRAVVSVAFSRDDFETVSGVAKSSGVRTSEFIRTAAIEKASVVTQVTLGLAGASQFSIVTTTVSISGTSTNAPLHTQQDQDMLLIGKML